jgi:hypothetical protein
MSPVATSMNTVAGMMLSEFPLAPLVVGGKRKLHFASEISEVVCSIPCVDDLSADEKSAVYWTVDEFKNIRRSAKIVTQDIRKQGLLGVADIEDAFATALGLCSMDDLELDELLKAPSGHTKSFEEWCSGQSNGRGLERYVSAIHRYKRTGYVKEARAAVLRMSRSDQISSDQLAAFYTEYAKSATVYARLIGHADEQSQIASSDDFKFEQSVSPPPRKTVDPKILLAKTPSQRAHLRVVPVRQLSQRMESASSA